MEVFPNVFKDFASDTIHHDNDVFKWLQGIKYGRLGLYKTIEIYTTKSSYLIDPE